MRLFSENYLLKITGCIFLLYAGVLLGQSNYQKIHRYPGFTSTVEVPGLNPAKIFHWLRTMDDTRFREWHDTHQEYRVLKETSDYTRSRFYFREVIERFEITGTRNVIYAQPPDTFIFKQRWLPVFWSLILTSTATGVKVVNDMPYGIGWT